MVLLQYPKCTTCQRARKWLEAHHMDVTVRHIVEETPTYEELSEWYQKSGLPLKRFFNTSGILYKSMQLKDKLSQMDEEAQLRLLASNGMLIKRPILIHGDTILVGFREGEWQSIIQ